MELDKKYSEKIRERIKVEDNLFNSRPTIFLAINGIWVSAAGINSQADLPIVFNLLGLAFSILWFICSMQSWRIIKKLNEDYIKSNNINPLENIVDNCLCKIKWLRPTEIIGLWLPISFIIAWFWVIITRSMN